LVARTQRWIEDNQRILLLGAAVAAAGGVGWYLYNKPSSFRGSGKGGSASAPGDAASGEGGAAGAAKKKKNKKKKAGGMKEGFLKGEGTEGPLLEEIPEAEREKAVSKEDDLFAGMSFGRLRCVWAGVTVSGRQGYRRSS
jgi:import receptor subunit TOM70